jgi:N-dimethylarginine dimethylaminohydrolase
MPKCPIPQKCSLPAPPTHRTVESQGDDGVLVGPRARGWNDSLFTEDYGFVGKYDNGGYLQPGTSLVHNYTGKPEPVLTDSQWNSVTQNGISGEGDVNLVAHVYVGNREITDIARVEVARANASEALSLHHGRRV